MCERPGGDGASGAKTLPLGSAAGRKGTCHAVGAARLEAELDWEQGTRQHPEHVSESGVALPASTRPASKPFTEATPSKAARWLAYYPQKKGVSKQPCRQPPLNHSSRYNYIR